MRRLAVAAALALTAAPAWSADDFEEEAPVRSVALGPAQPGTATLSADVGWLRSGLRADLGLGGGFDLGIRAEAFVLSRRLSSQKGGFAGLRWSPFEGTGLRVTLAAEIGFVFVPFVFGSRDLFVLRGEALIGHPVAGFMPYARAAVRGLRFDTSTTSGWDSDGEVGAGVERALGRAVLAAEVSTWLQPEVQGLAQWRLRAGWVF